MNDRCAKADCLKRRVQRTTNRKCANRELSQRRGSPQYSAPNPGPKMEILVRKGSVMKRNSKLTIATATAVLAVLGVLVSRADSAQDKYSLISPSGIAFSDFRGYEDWSVVSSARTDEVLKVIVANPDDDQGVQGRRSGQRPAFPGWLQDREAPVEV